jgi:hypothetical protein
MGFVSSRKDSAARAGSVVLDMLLKFDVLKYIEDGTWQLADNPKTRRLYSYASKTCLVSCAVIH